ncbi:MAG TPA: type II secretion system protein GspG, partial [Anaeromyxobacteraceae bacterium]|nr:type II secretion system protein GspG [Anaeromyxobacteraceae bacterium]
EWPMVRRKITSTAMTFERLREPAPDREERHGGAGREEADVDAAFDAFGGGAAAEKDDDHGALGANERRVFPLAVPGRTVEKIIDLSRLGEFESCKALLNLVNRGYLKPIAPAGRAAAVGTYAVDWSGRIRSLAFRVFATVAIAAAIAGIAYWVDRRGLAWGEASHGAALRDNAAQRFLARYQIQRLGGALEVYRLEKGEYPDRLEQLVGEGIVTARDLRHPWQQAYYYRRTPEGRYVLLPPIE